MHRPIAAAAAAALCATAAAHAATFTTSAPFIAAVQPGFDTETFEALAGFGGATLPLSGGGFTYTASTNANGLLVFSSSGVGQYLTTGTAATAIPLSVTFTFTSGNVTAFGGTFWVEDISGNVQSGGPFDDISVTFSDGAGFTLTSQTTSTFFGYTSSTVLTSVTISSNASHRFPGMNDLFVGAAIPAPGAAGAFLLAAAMTRRGRR